MKNKIEDLIKEVGINEIEAILKELKSKNNVKENIKQDFIELLNGCTVSFNSYYDDIDYRKDGELLFYYRKNSNLFTIYHNIWINFEKKHNLDHPKLSDLLVGVVEDILNYKGITLRVKS